MSKRVGSSDPRDDDEARAFEEAMRGAQPIAAGPRRVTGAPVAGPSRPGRASAAATASAARSPFETEALGEGLSGRARDVSLRVLRALRNGEHRPEARLDLHGQKREAALRATERFVSASRQSGRRVVLVIHGRGQNSEDGTAVLRPALQAWLGSAAAAQAGVMAFAPAPARAGGAGATLVLLRR